MRLNALIQLIRPLQLNGICADLLEFLRANVTDGHKRTEKKIGVILLRTTPINPFNLNLVMKKMLPCFIIFERQQARCRPLLPPHRPL